MTRLSAYGVLVISGSMLLAYLGAPSPAAAGACYADPVVTKEFSVKVVRDVYLRDNACTSGTTVLTTLPAGTVLKATADWGGWYKVTAPNGTVGWSWGDFFQKTTEAVTSAATPKAPATASASETCGAAAASYAGKLRATEQVRLRTTACTTGSILTNVPAGTVVTASQKVNGWYKIMLPGGTVGWSSGSYYAPVSDDTPVAPAPTNLASLKGRFLISKETDAAYYYHPKTGKLMPLATVSDLTAIARTGEGIRNIDIALIPTSAETKTGDTKLRTRMAGSVLLQVQSAGEAWYVYPLNTKRYALALNDRTIVVLRSLAKTVGQADLEAIDPAVKSAAAPAAAPVAPETAPAPDISFDGLSGAGAEPTVVPAAAGDSSDLADVKKTILYTSKGALLPGDGSFQKGAVPPGVDMARINRYVVNRINKERASRGQFRIVSDQRLIDTASVWAEGMYKQGTVTHTRVPTNKIARVWAWENFKLDFAEYWGWFYENIGGGNYDASGGDINASIERSMDKLIDYFMSEEKDNGIHFQTIMHDNLTHLGVGFYFDGSATSGKLYTVMHYAALAGRIPPIQK